MRGIKVKYYNITNEDNKLVLNIYIDQLCDDVRDVCYYSVKELSEEINFRKDICCVRLFATHKQHCNEIENLLKNEGVIKPFLYSKKWNGQIDSLGIF